MGHPYKSYYSNILLNFSDVMGTGVSKVLCPSLISLYFNVYMLQLIFIIRLMCHICPYLKH